MIYIENTSTDPHYNLAFEEYVFTVMDFREPVLLLWQNEPSVIVGRFQNTLEEINYEFISSNSVHVVRRNTGGGAVYHDLGNLNYSFIIPDVESKVDFKTFTIPVVKALRSKGIDAVQTGRNDIVIGDRKFSGNAQQFKNHTMLHHGTLMFDVETDNAAKALKAKPGKFRSKATKSVRSRMINLKPLLEVETAAEFKLLLKEWFDREYGLDEVKLTPEQLEAVEVLRDTKYASEEWNFGGSPKADVVRGDFFRCGEIVFHFGIDRHRIRSLKITGDFFTGGDIEELEKMFEGVDYRRDALGQVLHNVDLTKYFGDVTEEELLDVIV